MQSSGRPLTAVVAFEEMLLVKDVTLSLAPLSFARLAFVETICYTVSA